MMELSSKTDKFTKFILPVIVILTLVVYSPVLWHDFINFDDDVFVYQNPDIASGLTFETIRWAFTTAHQVNWMPLTWLSHALDVQLFGMNAGGHHFVNVILHAASSGLLYLFLKRSTGSFWRSALVASLFALHPLHVESVAWVAERKDVLSTFFGMLTLNAYIRYTERPGVARYIATLLLFLCGLLSKPMLVTLPVILLLLDWWPIGRLEVPSAGSSRGVLRVFVEKIPFFILSVGSSAITFFAQEAGGELVQGYTLLSRAGKVCIAYVSYLYKMVWPVDLAILYPFSKYPPSSLKIGTSIFLLFVVSSLVFVCRKRFPYLITGWLWYIVTLLPVIGLIQIGQHSIADRYTYIPLIGIFIIISWGFPDLTAGWQLRRVVLGGGSVLVLTILTVLTSRQLAHWKNGVTLFSHTVSVTVDNWVALNVLGNNYLQSGRIDEAISLYKESIRAKPSYVLAHLNLGYAYLAVNENYKAIDSFRLVLQLNSGNPMAHNNLCIAYLQLGEIELAREQYRILLEMGSPLAPDLLKIIDATALKMNVK